MKKEFFHELGYENIIEGKYKISTDRETKKILKQIINLRKHHALIITRPLIADVSPSGVPYASMDDRDLLWQRYLKWGTHIKLNHNNMTLEQALEQENNMIELRNSIFTNIPEQPAGYGFWGPRTGQPRTIHLVDCIKGAKLFAYSELSKDANEKIIIRKYNLDKKFKDEVGVGYDVMMTIPSEQISRSHYDMTLKSVPINEKDKHAIIFELDAEHNCGLRGSRVGGQYKPRERLLDFHIVAAYLFMAKDQAGLKNLVPFEMNPFLIPTEYYAALFKKIKTQVVMDYVFDNKRYKRAPNRAETEILLWEFIRQEGLEEAQIGLKTKKKLIDYKW